MRFFHLARLWCRLAAGGADIAFYGSILLFPEMPEISHDCVVPRGTHIYKQLRIEVKTRDFHNLSSIAACNRRELSQLRGLIQMDSQRLLVLVHGLLGALGKQIGASY